MRPAINKSPTRVLITAVAAVRPATDAVAAALGGVGGANGSPPHEPGVARATPGPVMTRE